MNQPLSLVGPRYVLWLICALVLLLGIWAWFGELDIIVSAEGRLVPQTLVKIVQPAEGGVIERIMVAEGEQVLAGQVMARLNSTIASADELGLTKDLTRLRMQLRRVQAERAGLDMAAHEDDDPGLYAQVHAQYLAHRRAFEQGIAQEQALLQRAQHERDSAMRILVKLERTLPAYSQSAAAYGRLRNEGFVSNLAAIDKEREALEKAQDLEAQKATVQAALATIAAQEIKIKQLASAWQSDLEKEAADLQAQIAQLLPGLAKSTYRRALTELRAPQDGVIKDLHTTTEGAVVQPGTLLMTLVPSDEALHAEVALKNEDAGFVQVGQPARIKLAAYPFQKYGMVDARVMLVGADASERPASDTTGDNPSPPSTYKVKLRLEAQQLVDPNGARLTLLPGMQIVAEIQQGKRTVLEYLLSPVRKLAAEAARER